MENKVYLEMRNIKKSFNGVKVLKGVSLQVQKGEVHALLGENGAGKSTLMNILGGVHQPDSGSITIEGRDVKMSDPRESKANGVSFIHQELNVVPDLMVYENLFLGTEIKNKFGFLNVEEMCRQTADILGRLGVEIHPKNYVRELDNSYKQFIEIAKSLLHKSELIIMDEPTSSLADHEVERLFTFIRNLKETGVSIIYISHKLKEIEEICDRFTVLRDGELAGAGIVKEFKLDQITKLMVGKAISNERFEHKESQEAVLLEVNNLSSEGLYKNINFSVKAGEVVGFTGLAGDGRTELFESIFGYRKKYTGQIKVRGQVLKIDHPQKAVKAKIGFVPKNRKENAIIKDLSVIHNMSLSSLSKFNRNGLLDQSLERKRFRHYKDLLNIKVHDPNITIDKLSGGNQQKVMLAKWLEADPDILIFDNPTQGIDVGAKQEIYEQILALAAMGKAIIILSSEAPEILRLCQSIYVMYQGEIVSSFNGNRATEDMIMSYATGAKREDEQIG
ncbi:sugar ABC transporter ATP-binding protein [Bacillus mesophilum]|uniref:Sugar ABC transporter ATP-binding protein n=1 Tax=Bacillus mesophilum TaxID=1071718 RepID=A0A7V7RJ18_9BACI|nr:sugar ABC transporter ATP-binding protein [Bacillus mesophilum]KAB2330634.1 sugar ABC transporter ATP-binding protein [Bacillus mesophilum]